MPAFQLLCLYIYIHLVFFVAKHLMTTPLLHCDASIYVLACVTLRDYMAYKFKFNQFGFICENALLDYSSRWLIKEELGILYNESKVCSVCVYIAYKIYGRF